MRGDTIFCPEDVLTAGDGPGGMLLSLYERQYQCWCVNTYRPVSNASLTPCPLGPSGESSIAQG